MKSMNRLSGLPVILSGKRIGLINRAVLSGDMQRLEGVLVNCGIKGTRFVPESQIELLGDVSVIARSQGMRKNVGGQSGIVRALTTDGLRIGAVCDAWIDEETRDVRALSITTGYLDDLRYGRKRIFDYQVRRQSGDVVVQMPDTQKEGPHHAYRHDDWTFDRVFGGRGGRYGHAHQQKPRHTQNEPYGANGRQTPDD